VQRGQPRPGVVLPHAAIGQEGLAHGLSLAQAGQAAAVGQVGVVQHGHHGQQALGAGGVPAPAGGQGLLQGRPGHVEQHRHAGGGLFVGAAQAVGAHGRAAVRRRGEPRAVGQGRAPDGLQGVAQAGGCERQALGQAPAGGGAQQAQVEDGAAVGVDAAGGRQHAALGLDAAGLQRRPARALEAQGGQARVGVAQREQAAQEGAGVHVLVAAGVHIGHQARLGVQGQFVVQGQGGGAADGGQGGAGRGVRRVQARRAQALCRLWHGQSSTRFTPSMRRTSSAPTWPARQAAHSRQATAAPSGHSSSPSSRGRPAGRPPPAPRRRPFRGC
jgi:hypothetical protein